MLQNPELVITSIKTATKVVAEFVNNIFEPLSYKALAGLIFIGLILLKYFFDR